MSKIEFVQLYIDKCDSCQNYKELQEEIKNVFACAISSISSRIDQGDIDYGNDYGDYCRYIEPNYQRNILTLKQILEEYKATLIDEEQKRHDELEKLHLQAEISKNNIQVNAYGGNANSSATSNAASTVTINIDQTISAINQIPDTVLSAVDKEELEEKLSAVEVAKTSGNKEKLAGKVENALKYIADKGIEVGIAALPYLGEISKLIQTM